MNKTLLNVVKNTILTSATIHLIILAVVAIKDQNLSLVNAFNILDIDLLYPQSIVGVTNFILSYAVIFGIALFFILKEKHSK